MIRTAALATLLLLTCGVVTGTARAAEPAAKTSLKTIPVAGHGDLLLSVPEGWTASVERSATGGPPSIEIKKTDSNYESVRVSVLTDETGDQTFNSPSEIRKVLEARGKDVLPEAKETSLRIEELKGTSTTGYYFVITYKKPPKRTAAHATFAAIGAGDLLLIARIPHTYASGPYQRGALDILKTSSQKAIAPNTVSKPEQQGTVSVTVPGGAPPAQQDATATTAPAAEFDAIERIQWQHKPKRLVRSQATVTSMMVRIADDGQATGLVSDIIATIPPQSRSSKKSSGIGFARADGDPMMRTALEEAVRAVTLRYPIWEYGHIEVSFGEKFVRHGGPSAGTAFGLLMLSCLEDFEIDAKCAVTGDITVDWKVRKVGGVTAKLRGATLDKCLYAAIPVENETAFGDMALLYGNSSLWDIQVFSIATLQQAVAIARTDRAPRLAEAIKLFAELQSRLANAEKATLKSAGTRDLLKHILELAPNHLSAKHLLAVCESTAPKTLSANATIYQLSVIFYPYRVMLAAHKPIDRTVLPAHVTTLARKRLNALRPIAHKDLQGLITDMAAYIEAMDGFAADSASFATVKARAERLDARFAELGSDPALVEKLIREGY